MPHRSCIFSILPSHRFTLLLWADHCSRRPPATSFGSQELPGIVFAHLPRTRKPAAAYAVLQGGMSMKRAQEYRDLCSACENALGCTFPRDPKKPVLQCEEFDGGEPSRTKTAGKQPPAPPGTQTADEDLPANLMGLCRNCEERERCKFPKPEGGVWHCEEYR